MSEISVWFSSQLTSVLTTTAEWVILNGMETPVALPLTWFSKSSKICRGAYENERIVSD